jgi:hypothetical protein
MKKLLFAFMLVCSTAYADKSEYVIIVEDKVNGVGFRDAIRYASEAEYQAKVADGTHQAERTLRVYNFRQALENPPVQKPPTEEELLAEKREIEERLTSVDMRITEERDRKRTR